MRTLVVTLYATVVLVMVPFSAYRPSGTSSPPRYFESTLVMECIGPPFAFCRFALARCAELITSSLFRAALLPRTDRKERTTSCVFSSPFLLFSLLLSLYLFFIISWCATVVFPLPRTVRHRGTSVIWVLSCFRGLSRAGCEVDFAGVSHHGTSRGVK